MMRSPATRMPATPQVGSVRQVTRGSLVAIVAGALLCACGGDGGGASSPTTARASATAGATTTTAVTSTTAAPAPVVPAGELGVVPLQYRDDEVAGRMQLEVVNGSGETLRVTAVQFVWEGFTTEVAERENAVGAGQRVDFPVPLPAATCTGDGTASSMPDVATAIARLTLASGEVREAKVYDTKGVAAALYLRDCERQRVAVAVTLAWTELVRVEVDGRPVTRGLLTVTRGAAGGDIAVLAVGSTITYLVVPVDEPAAGAPLLVLPEGEATVSLPMYFLEGRCDAHALAEAKQPFRFVLQLDLGDGQVHPFILEPPKEAQEAMRATVFDGCVALGLVEPLG